MTFAGIKSGKPSSLSGPRHVSLEIAANRRLSNNQTSSSRRSLDDRLDCLSRRHHRYTKQEAARRATDGELLREPDGPELWFCDGTTALQPDLPAVQPGWWRFTDQSMDYPSDDPYDDEPALLEQHYSRREAMDLLGINPVVCPTLGEAGFSVFRVV